MKKKTTKASIVLAFTSVFCCPAWAINWTSEISAIQKGKFDEAVSKFTKLIDVPKPPRDYEIYKFRGIAYLGLKDYEKAIQDMDSAIACVKTSADSNQTRGMLHYYKGLGFQGMGRPLEAEKEFQLAFEEFPDMDNYATEGIQLITNANVRAFWNDFLNRVRVTKAKLASGEFKQQAELAKSETSAKNGQEKLDFIKASIQKQDYQTAYTEVFDYFKGDKQRLAIFSAKYLEAAALGTQDDITGFNLMAAAIQTNITGDTLRANSLGKAAVSIFKSQPPSPLNLFCKNKLAGALPEVIASGLPNPPIDIEPPSTLDQRDPNRPITDKWAIIVGIGNFADKTIPSLKYPTKDAKDFYNFLINQAHFAPDHIRLLLNENATQRRILTELGDKFLPRVARKDDLVVLYLSSHGSPSKVDVRDKNYLVAYDTEKSNLFASGIEMQDLTQLIKSRVDSERVLIVLDACHSGAADANAKDANSASNFDAAKISQGSGQLVICSSKPTERSWESRRYTNGVFTRKLIEGLQKNGSQTKLGDAFTFTKNEVHNEVQEDEGITQTPVLKSKWNGNDLILTAAPSEPRSLPQSVKQLLSPDSSSSTPNSQSKPVLKK